MSEDVTAERIVNLDDGVIKCAPYIAVSNIMEELGLSEQTEVEEEENNDDDKNSIEYSFYQRKENPLRSKSALDVLKTPPNTVIKEMNWKALSSNLESFLIP